MTKKNPLLLGDRRPSAGSMTVSTTASLQYFLKRDTFVILTYFYDFFLLMLQNVYFFFFCQSAFVKTNSLLTVVDAKTPRGPIGSHA